MGNSGAGKSTLAQKLARDEGRLPIALDDFAFVAKSSERRSLGESAREIRRVAGDSRCVIEGCYADLVEALATSRDHLVWLDPPIDVSVTRAKSRAWEPSKWPTKEQQDSFLPKLVSFIEGYATDASKTGRPAHKALFDAFPGTVERVS